MRTIRAALGVAVTVAVLAVTGPAAADDRAFPHIHYRGNTFQADGTPFPFAVNFSPGQINQFGPPLAPPNCFDGGAGKSGGGSSAGSYTLLIAVLDTPACVAAMQTFNPPASAFPDVTQTGWVFRRQ